MTVRRFFLFFTLAFVAFLVFRAIRDKVSIFNPPTITFSLYLITISLGEFKQKVIAKARKPIHDKLPVKPFKEEFVPAFISFYLFAAILFIFLAVLLVTVSLWLYGLFFILGAIATITFAMPVKLILSKEGIELRTFLKNENYKWDEIIEIAKYFDGSEIMILSEKRRKIALSTFETNWKKREIGRIIRENAPLEFLE